MTTSTSKTVEAAATAAFNLILDPINDIASEVVEERLAQLEQYGDQHHESSYSEPYRVQFETLADRWKQINAARVENGKITWDGLLLEEVYEALAESDPEKRAVELIQVAAVAIAEVQNLRGQVDVEPIGEDEAAA